MAEQRGALRKGRAVDGKLNSFVVALHHHGKAKLANLPK